MIGLSSFLAQSNVNSVTYERFPDILDVLVSLLKYVQYIDSQKQNERQKNKINQQNKKVSNPKILQKFLDNTNDDMIKSMVDETLSHESHYSHINNEEAKQNSDESSDSDDSDDEVKGFSLDTAEQVLFSLI